MLRNEGNMINQVGCRYTSLSEIQMQYYLTKLFAEALAVLEVCSACGGRGSTGDAFRSHCWACNGKGVL